MDITSIISSYMHYKKNNECSVTITTQEIKNPILDSEKSKQEDDGNNVLKAT